MALEEQKKIELSGREFTLTPLNLIDMQLLEQIGTDMQAEKITPRMGIIQTADIIFRSAQVAEPSLEADDVKRCLTLRNFPRAMKALLQVSGLILDDEPTEKKTESQASESIGTTSTEPSSPQRDGVSEPSTV